MSIVEKAVFHIEMNRACEIQLSDIARSCDVTPFHLSRVFRAVTGRSVMAYVRARRLGDAAQALAFGKDDILAVALEAQYGSHEAFTRAFSDHFGVSPKRVRTAQSITNLEIMEPFVMDTSLLVDLSPPRFETRKAFQVTGLSGQFTFETNSGIPTLWQAFNEISGDVPGRTGNAAYGVCYNGDSNGNFDYMAGVTTLPGSTQSDDLKLVKIPAGNYAVFTHSGHISQFSKTVYTIWNKGLAEAEVTSRNAPDFELYDQRFDPATGQGDVEVWIPIT